MAQLAFSVVLILLLFVSSSAAAQYNHFNKYTRNRNAQLNAAKKYYTVNQNEQTTQEFTLDEEETPVHGLRSETPPSASPPPNNPSYHANQNMNNALGEEAEAEAEVEKFKAYAKNKYDEDMYKKYTSEFDEVNNPPPHTPPHSSNPYKQSQKNEEGDKEKDNRKYKANTMYKDHEENNPPPSYTVRVMGNPFTGKPQNNNVDQNEEAYYSTKTNNNNKEEHQSQHYDLNDVDTNPNKPQPPYRGFVRSAFTGTLEFDMVNPEEAEKESFPTSFDEEMFDPDNAGEP